MCLQFWFNVRRSQINQMLRHPFTYTLSIGKTSTDHFRSHTHTRTHARAYTHTHTHTHTHTLS